LKAKPWASTSGGLAVVAAAVPLPPKSRENQPVTAAALHAGPRTTTFRSPRAIVATGHAPNALHKTRTEPAPLEMLTRCQ
jgi:hypothetical protein